MDFIIVMLLVVNFVLSIAWVVAVMARMDRRYARQVRDREEYKSHFRVNRRRDD